MDDTHTNTLAHLIAAGDALAAFALEIALERERASGDVMDGAEARALVAEWEAAIAVGALTRDECDGQQTLALPEVDL